MEWDKGWSQSKTITVKAHDTESGLGQYAVTRTADRPAEWQDSNVFANITENGTYYLWAKDKDVYKRQVYDKAQTAGDPVPVRGILRDGTPDMEKALGALLQLSLIHISTICRMRRQMKPDGSEKETGKELQAKPDRKNGGYRT